MHHFTQLKIKHFHGQNILLREKKILLIWRPFNVSNTQIKLNPLITQNVITINNCYKQIILRFTQIKHTVCLFDFLAIWIGTKVFKWICPWFVCSIHFSRSVLQWCATDGTSRVQSLLHTHLYILDTFHCQNIDMFVYNTHCLYVVCMCKCEE